MNFFLNVGFLSVIRRHTTSATVTQLHSPSLTVTHRHPPSPTVTPRHSVTVTPMSHPCHSATPHHTITLSHHDTPASHCITLPYCHTSITPPPRVKPASHRVTPSSHCHIPPSPCATLPHHVTPSPRVTPVSLVTLYILRHSHTHGSATPHHTISLLVMPLVAAFCFRLSVTSCLSISVCGPILTLGVTLSHSVTSSHLCHSATPSHTIILSHHDTPAPHCIALTPVSLRRPGSSRNTCVTPSLPVSLRHRHSPSLHDPRHSDRQTH